MRKREIILKCPSTPLDGMSDYCHNLFQEKFLICFSAYEHPVSNKNMVIGGYEVGVVENYRSLKLSSYKKTNSKCKRASFFIIPWLSSFANYLITGQFIRHTK